MAEYVAKDKLWDTFDNEPFYDNADKDEIVLPIIDSFLAADVAQVVHGQWNVMPGTKTRRVCSHCGWDVPEYGKFYSYCPNCGAKMDGGADDEV